MKMKKYADIEHYAKIYRDTFVNESTYGKNGLYDDEELLDNLTTLYDSFMKLNTYIESNSNKVVVTGKQIHGAGADIEHEDDVFAYLADIDQGLCSLIASFEEGKWKVIR